MAVLVATLARREKEEKTKVKKMVAELGKQKQHAWMEASQLPHDAAVAIGVVVQQKGDDNDGQHRESDYRKHEHRRKKNGCYY